MPLAYILLTYGPRHGIALHRHPAAQVQIKHIRGLLPENSKIGWCHDYARRIRGIEDLPKLHQVLQKMSAPDLRTLLVVSDLSVLFKKATIEGRLSIADALHQCADQVVDLSRGTRLSQMPQQIVNAIIQHGALRQTVRNPSWRARSLGAAKKDTELASSVSRQVRGKHADQKAEALKAIYLELAAQNGAAPTMTALAQEANGRGMLTTRNKPWSPSTAGRALRRLKSTP